MPECELCGKKAKLLNVRIDGVQMAVCPECAPAGKIIESPKVKIRSKSQIREAFPEEHIVEDFSSKVRHAREQLGLKQEELAVKIGERLSVIRAIESGKRPDLKTARKLEQALKIKLVDVL